VVTPFAAEARHASRSGVLPVPICGVANQPALQNAGEEARLAGFVADHVTYREALSDPVPKRAIGEWLFIADGEYDSQTRGPVVPNLDGLEKTRELLDAEPPLVPADVQVFVQEIIRGRLLHGEPAFHARGHVGTRASLLMAGGRPPASRLGPDAGRALSSLVFAGPPYGAARRSARHPALAPENRVGSVFDAVPQLGHSRVTAWRSSHVTSPCESQWLRRSERAGGSGVAETAA
jgi:hypothetical protein